MPATAESQKLIARLERIRLIAFRRWVLYGITAVASGGVYALLTILFLDWWLNMPSAPRLAISLVFLVGFALAATHWIYRPIRSGIGVAEIAARIERYFGDFHDRLSSLVSFVRSSENTSPAMVRQFLVNTERIIAQRDLEGVLTAKPLITSTAFLCASVSILVAVALNSPHWLWTGMSRYLDPFGAVEWPRQVEIAALTRNIKTPLSESARVRMTVTRGLQDTLRGVVHLRDAEGRTTTLAMSRDGDEFEAVIQPVLSDQTYWFQAGDADTRRDPGSITVIHRPEVEEVLLTIHPPAYAQGVEPSVQTLSAEPVEVIRGSTVEVSVRSSKSAPADAGAEHMGLAILEKPLLPFTSASPDGRRLACSFEVAEDVQFRVSIADEDGYQNQGAPLHTLLARQDAPPRVSLIQPTSALECTSHCVIPLAAEIEDDFGIADVALESKLATGEDQPAAPIAFETTTRAARAKIGADVAHDWDVGALGVQPGDVIQFSIAATDNFPGEEGRGQVGRSPALQLRVISDAEYERRVREQLHAVERQIRQTQLDQEDVLQALDRLTAEDASKDWTPQRKEQVAAAVSRESRLARNLKDLARRLKTLSAQMQANGVEDRDWPAEVRQVGESLASTAAEPMTAAISALSEAREQEDPAARDAALEKAADESRAALKRLEAALEGMSRWGDAQGLASRIKDFLERQENVRAATGEVGKDMVGIPADALKPDQKAALELVARRQEQLNDEVDKSLARLREQAAALPEDQRSAREALDEALREAASNDLSRHMNDAAEAIRQNRTAAAGISQQAAEDAMRKMASGLREGQRRELDELRKSLDRAEDILADLLRQQEDLTTATKEAVMTAAPADVLTAMGATQDQLRTNTRWAGEEIADLPRAADAARLVRQAVPSMGDAATALNESRADNALAPQEEAARLLKDALAALSQLNEEVRQEVVRRSLEEIRVALRALVDAQKPVTSGVADLKTRIDQAARVGRLEAKTASDLSRDQSQIKKQADEALADMEDAPVFHWSLQRVTRWMDDAADRLSRRAINGDLVELSARILHELETLSSAVDSTESLVTDPQFAGEDQGGGGDGQGGQNAGQKPVPTVTELLVLKAMQLDINQRTRDLNTELADVQPTEAQLRQLRTLGEDQADLRRLTEKLVEEARGGG